MLHSRLLLKLTVWAVLACGFALGVTTPRARAADAPGTAPAPTAGQGVEPVKSARIALQAGRPTLLVNDRVTPFAAYCNCILNPMTWPVWNQYFASRDIDLYYLNLPEWSELYQASWSAETMAAYRVEAEKANQLTLEVQVAKLLEMRPTARFIVRWGVPPSRAWQAAHPDDLQLADGGKRYPDASLASADFRRDVQVSIANLVTHVESRPWGNRVIGYILFPLGEGVTPLACDGHVYDHSPAMQNAWRSWLTKTYGTEAALRQATGVADVTFDTATTMPSDAEARRVLGALPLWPGGPGPAVLHADYVRLQQKLFHDWYIALLDGLHAATAKRPVLTGIDALKQPLLGWQIRESFFGVPAGTDTLDILAFSGSLGVGPLLDHPGLGVLMTPADYHARGLGYGFEGEGLGDSLVLRGKTQIIENDARTWLGGEGPERKPPLGAFMTPAELRAGLLRNTGIAMSRGLMHYWMDIDGGFFKSDEAMDQVAVDRDAIRRITTTTHRETEHAIALMIDDTAPLATNFTTAYHNLAVIRQRLDELALCGIPYRIHLVSDLARPDFPAYRCYLFPNLFQLTDSTLRALREKVFRDGRIAIFGPGTAIRDYNGTTSAANAERLLGMPMKLYPATVPRHVRITASQHPALCTGGIPTVYGDSLAYGPVLLPDSDRLKELDGPSSAETTRLGAAWVPPAAPPVTVLGDSAFSWYLRGPGLVLRQFGKGAAGNGVAGPRGAGDYAVVFSAAMPIPAGVLRGLAHYGGCHVWVDGDAVVGASDTLVSVHRVATGPFRLNLPRVVATVTDAVTGDVVARDVDHLDLDFAAPDTRIFLLAP